LSRRGSGVGSGSGRGVKWWRGRSGGAVGAVAGTVEWRVVGAVRRWRGWSGGGSVGGRPGRLGTRVRGKTERGAGFRSTPLLVLSFR
jgi:hypothetical protein